MSNEKRYYWLKMKEDFFRQKEIKKLRSIAGGDTYTIIYLKMLLASLPTDGKLYYEGIEDNFVKEIALQIDEDPDNVSIVVSFLLRCGILIEESETEFIMSTTEEMTGSETASAERMRRMRNSKKKAIETIKTTPLEQDDIPYKNIIDYLNNATGSQYRSNSRNTRQLIKARYNEGFVEDDFYTVIDNKTKEWGRNPEMNQYLRPQTLFGTKFESYLNQKQVTKEDNFVERWANA